ncbi:hypothetical protein CBR_g18620 [Chara braunii]|uniref:Endoplasmic reticulum vesicle transporter C-terminal domain-containing protein n=1 Tax=Chara braunii TaxID=69332 RepID=A0A388JTB0_CHABU|nr:hypothetical protein CBR_g18620 [Chara braunii]|eukprot:GBG61025.1 hypothetical protein CBR_g18620 [Chara braunii]
MEVLNRLKNWDAYPKINEDFYSRTLSGGVITIVSSIFMVVLFFTELRIYLHTTTNNALFVDTSRGETLQINLNITFPHLACTVLSLDAMDISGEQQLDVVHNIFKRRLDPTGVPIDTATKDVIGGEVIEKPKDKHGREFLPNETYCGSCYGAEESSDQCCNTCDAVREAYRKRGWAFAQPELVDQCNREGFLTRVKTQAGEGCNVYGFLEVNKVAGNFHIAPGRSFQQAHMHVHDLVIFENQQFNISHTINSLSFGAHFPGVVNPLDGEVKIQAKGSGMYQYFIKVVPTIYRDIRGAVISTNQFSVTEHFRPVEVASSRSLPGVFFFYDLSPIKVKFTEERSSFLHFLTNVCAIVGGVFTVSGIIDAFIYHGHKAIKKRKMQLGKLN